MFAISTQRRVQCFVPPFQQKVLAKWAYIRVRKERNARCYISWEQSFGSKEFTLVYDSNV